MDKTLNFIRGFVRPFIAYVFSGVTAGLVVYAFVRWGNDDVAKTLITAFVGIIGTIIGVYYGQRQGKGAGK